MIPGTNKTFDKVEERITAEIYQINLEIKHVL